MSSFHFIFLFITFMLYTVIRILIKTEPHPPHPTCAFIVMNKEEQLDRNGGKTNQTHLSSYSFLIFRINDTNFRLFIQVDWDSLVFQFFKLYFLLILIIYNKKKCNGLIHVKSSHSKIYLLDCFK